MRVILSAGGDLRDSREIFGFTNENTIVVPQLESKEAFDNLDAILQVEGLDYFAGGPQDIAQSMGHPGEPDHPVSVEAFEAACAKVRASGKHTIADHIETIDVSTVVVDSAHALIAEVNITVKVQLSRHSGS